MASRYPVPFSSSRELRGFDPLSELHREMDRLFDDVFGGRGPAAGGGAVATLPLPKIDVHEDEREICITADLPGVKPNEVDLRLDGDTLTISGERKQEAERKQENYHVMERSHGRFRRTIQLPFTPDPDQVRAEGNHGVLTIHLPRQPQQERSRRIEVREAGGESGEQQQVGVESGGGTTGGPDTTKH